MTLKASVAIVKLGYLELEGLLLEDGTEAIAIPQLSTLNLVPPNRSQKQLEALLDIRFSSHQKVKTPLNSKAVNAISLIEFEEILLNLVIKGNPGAIALSRALIGLSLKQLWADAFNVNLTKDDRASYLKDRILNTPSPWKRMYEKEACEKAFAWYGANFYWLYAYSWMSAEEQCKVNRLNPVVNGKRATKIHQFIDQEVRDRLTPHMTRLVGFLISSTSKQDFETRMGRVFGCNQLELPLS
jgi:hypothetical protein